MCSWRLRPACWRKITWSMPAPWKAARWACMSAGSPMPVVGISMVSPSALRMACSARFSRNFLEQPRAPGRGVMGDQGVDGVAEEIEARRGPPPHRDPGAARNWRPWRYWRSPHGRLGRTRLCDAVVDVGPHLGLARIDKGEGEGPDAVRPRCGSCRGWCRPSTWADGGSAPVWARYCGRAWRNTALEAGIGREDHHVGDLFGRLQTHRIARFSLAGIEKASSSRRVAPSPMPKSTRPCETRSSVARHSAVLAGWL